MFDLIRVGSDAGYSHVPHRDGSLIKDSHATLIASEVTCPLECSGLLYSSSSYGDLYKTRKRQRLLNYEVAQKYLYKYRYKKAQVQM